MLDQILKDCKKQLEAALKHKKHPFRFFTLGTLQKGQGARLRTVVLRDFDPDQFLFTVFTDTRSKKVQQLKQNPNATGLFYDPIRMIQLVVDLKTVELKEETDLFDNLPEQSKKDYTSVFTPGSIIATPDQLNHDYNTPHFTRIQFQAECIEYLKLKRPNHIRASFSLEDQWRGTFLTP